MNQGMEETKIEQLQKLKNQLRYWRWGALAAGVFIVIACVDTIHGAVDGLASKGPQQEKFVSHLSTGLQRDIVPMLEQMAGQTLREVKPEVEGAFQTVNNRVPELANATLTELEALKTNLPKRGEKVLTDSFGEMLARKEEKLHSMFPEATDEQITRLLTNLAESATSEASIANEELFSKHREALEKIYANLETIRNAEGHKLASVDPNWEMGLLVLDIFRHDLERIRPDKNGNVLASQPAPQAKPKANATHAVKAVSKEKSK